jgi:hypothetical protein
MSSSARSLFIFGLYLILLGSLIIVAPNLFLRLFGLPATNEVWIRVVGVLLIPLGFHDVMAARIELTEFFRWTIYMRLLVFILFSVFVMLRLAPPVLILFGSVDLLGAIWTAVALRSSPAAYQAR